jgi:hypothetical protein
MIELKDRFYLGKLCAKGHVHEDTGKSLRYRTKRACVQCHREAQNPLSSAFYAAKRRKMPFNLSRKWFDETLPIHCPVFGTPLQRGGKSSDSRPSIDKLIPEHGYVTENCRIISGRANRIKSDATLEELKALVAYLEKELAPSQELVLK